MPDIVIHVITAAVYVGLAWHFWRTRWQRRAPPAELQAWERGAILVPLALHGWLLYSQVFAAPELRFGFAQALSVMMWLTVLLLWIETFFHRVELVQPLALGLAAACAPLPALFVGRATGNPASVEFKLHLALGLLAYSLFTVAMLHEILITLVERRLHAVAKGAEARNIVLGDRFSHLPPLLTLEKIVFRQLGAAFLVLTLTLAIGVAYSEALFGRAMRFDHKTVFVVLSWIVFGLLLAGRRLYGWRGRTALRWTITGFVMLLLAYPGSRFVLEVVLHRP